MRDFKKVTRDPDNKYLVFAKNETTYYEITTIGQGKGVIDEGVGKDVELYEETEISSRISSESLNEKYDLVSEFDASICSGGNFYDIFENEEEIITEGSIVWVNTNKTIWEGRFIKIPFSDFLEDARHLKLIWINTKMEDSFLIRNCSK